jgi:hypothetical protein
LLFFQRFLFYLPFLFPSLITSPDHIDEGNFTCSFGHSPPCPITLDNVQDTLAIGRNWSHSFSSICSLFSNFSQPIRVIVFGGSMTWGESTKGCCCEIDESCEETSECRHDFEEARIGGKSYRPCAWPNQFGRWLQKKFPHLQIVYLNSAARASRSDFILELLFIHFHPNSPQRLGSNDLILIDYSVNDASDAPQAGVNLELALRKILTAYDSRPKVLLIETYGYAFHSNSLHVPIGQSSHSADYSTLHRAVAKHYSLPYWSPINAVWSSVKRGFTNLPSNLAFTETHPPWHVHLFIADIIAATFLSEYHHWCSSSSSSSTPSPPPPQTKVHFPVLESLPPPLYGAHAPPDCQLTQFVININAVEEYKKLGTRRRTSPSSQRSSLMTQHRIRRRIEVLSSFPLNTSHYPARWDVVDSVTNQLLIPPQETINNSNIESSLWLLTDDHHRNKPGWIAYPQASDHNISTLRFYFQTPIDFVSLDSSTTLTLSIGYLKTYENVGKVEVGICGESIGIRLDGLWDRPEFHHVSLIQFRYAEISLGQLRACDHLPMNQRYLSVTPTQLHERVKNKFKIMSIRLC